MKATTNLRKHQMKAKKEWMIDEMLELMKQRKEQKNKNEVQYQKLDKHQKYSDYMLTFIINGSCIIILLMSICVLKFITCLGIYETCLNISLCQLLKLIVEEFVHFLTSKYYVKSA